MKKKTKTKKKAKRTSPNLRLARLILDDLNETKLEYAVRYLRTLQGPKTS